MKNYTIRDLRKEFPSDEACLAYIFKNKYPNAKQYYKVTGRKCYAHSMTGHQIHPLAGTVFEDSSTPLTLWFHALFLFATSKNGVSAKELQRQLGVTYKCAWRMGHQIRKLMEQGKDPLSGTVEIDETYYGKGGNRQTRMEGKTALLGMVERKGRVRVKPLPNRKATLVLPVVKETVASGSHIVTDEYRGYDKLYKLGYRHSNVKHGRGHYSWKGQNTNTIEGFWGQFKRSVRGTYHFVSSKHLPKYVDEFAFRYNHRSAPCFQTLVLRAATL